MNCERTKRERSGSGRSAYVVALTKKNVTLRIRRVIDMFGIDEGKNLVADKLYEFFMEPIGSDYIDIDEVSYPNFAVGDMITIACNTFSTSYIRKTINLSNAMGHSGTCEFLIVPYVRVSEGATSVNYDDYPPSFYNSSGMYREFVRLTSFFNTITIGLPYNSYNSTNIYYYSNCYWRILRIA